VSENGYLKFVTALLNGGANPNLQNAELATPLHLAVARGHTEVAKVLLEKGASQDILDQVGCSIS
jgi:uncharacterized protein